MIYEEGVTEACEERGGHRGVRRSRHLSCESTLALGMYPAIDAFRPSVSLPTPQRPFRLSSVPSISTYLLTSALRFLPIYQDLAHSLMGCALPFSSSTEHRVWKLHALSLVMRLIGRPEVYNRILA